MKNIIKIKILLLVFLLFFSAKENIFSQSGNNDTSHILLSSSDFDYKNPQFDKSMGTINYFIKDCLFAYEKWSSPAASKVCVRLMNYNSLGAETEFGAENSLNIKPAVAYSEGQWPNPSNNEGAVIYQSDQNGNFDIFISLYDTVSWSAPSAAVSGSEDETDPVIVSFNRDNFFNIVIAYKRGADIYMKSYYNGVWRDEVNITADDSLNCFSPALIKSFVGTGTFYIAYLRESDSLKNSISYRSFQVNSDGSINLNSSVINISQPNSQDNIRFSNGINNSMLNYDYDTLGHMHFYSAMIGGSTYKLFNQSSDQPGNNYRGTGSSHGDITSDFPGGYSLYTWISKVDDSVKTIVRSYNHSYGKFFTGNSSASAFVNSSTKLTYGMNNLFRIRILWHKEINGRTALIETFRDDYLSSISGNNGTPLGFKLHQNYPNPFNPKTIINYEIDAAEYISIKIYNIKGEEIASLVNERKNAGSYSAEFDGRDLASGIYFYSLTIDGKPVISKRMILLK
ncbi:MAG: T9SS type A sorting domain-containing protein [Ignavibacteria bacterium]|nr:T9SS type A sorting domain-containing protein [Ignavibacteria bacterium]